MRESTLWFWHLIAGVVILFVLGIHIGVMHLDKILQALGILSAGDVLTYASVLARAKSVAYLVIYLLLIGFALYHGFYGLRSMILEISMSKTAEKIVNWVIVLFGLALFVYGAYAIIVGYSIATNAA
jgi:succinate dehydrogenase / fumarate reductase membrane anchor subunit